MTMMERYEMVRRVERVKIINYRGTPIEIGQESKVYKVTTRCFPSGQKYCFLVWSKKAERCVLVRIDDVEIIAMSEEPIHHF